ncbi:hypothetical protein PPYR_13203 [Photinus pyralis]|uniref:Uncharacterized protein n=2 Tax=Photinus pyralis TaxID=7054 RepID=A0A5N4A8D6_PHOPY|nr:hypothetical protein PPYR_13203 [Photinus pyralis]
MQLISPYIALLLMAVTAARAQFNLMDVLGGITGGGSDDDSEDDYGDYMGLVQDLIQGATKIAESVASGFMASLKDNSMDVETRMQYSNGTDLSYRTVEDFSRNITLHNIQSVKMILQLIHESFVTRNGEQMQDAVFDPIAAILQDTDGDMMCKTNQSAQQLVYGIYSAIQRIEQKGFLILQFSYTLLRLYNDGKDDKRYIKKAEQVRNLQVKRALELAKVAKKLLPTLSREFRRCDPLEHVAGRTYLEITQLLQGHIQNIVDLNSKGSCLGNCGSYALTKSYGCQDDRSCSKLHQCRGNIMSCKFIDSDMQVCPAGNDTNRRYDYVEYANGRLLGQKHECRNSIFNVASWWWLISHCTYCFCLCDEEGANSDRYFNLRPVFADVLNNMVVTGLRFTKVNRVIHLQIQEGQLLPKGEIDNKTLRWVPVDGYDINDGNVINGRDYHTLTWEQRSVDLDDLIAEDEHVLTGVHFQIVRGHLNLQILVTPFDHEKGLLIQPAQLGRWVNGTTTNRTEVTLDKPGVPARAGSACWPDSKTGQYVTFTHTDLESDAAQTTVPFLDAQPVVPKTAVPLAGAGLYHRGESSSGGFIAPKIITYDFGMRVELKLLGK